MTPQVSLSREAYPSLGREKRPPEIFSDVVLRLLREHRARRRDPWKFVRARSRRLRGVERRLAEVEALRDADRVPRSE